MPSRPYAHPADLPLVLDFLRVARPPERSDDFPARVDLEEFLKNKFASIREDWTLEFTGTSWKSARNMAVWR